MKKMLFYSLVIAVLFYVSACKENSTGPDPAVVQGWDTYSLPDVTFTNLDSQGNASTFPTYIATPVSLIKSEIESVTKILYSSPSDMPKINSIEFIVKDTAGTISTSFGVSSRRIVLSSSYFKSLTSSSGSQDKQTVIDSITSALTEEIIRSYQNQCDETSQDGASVMSGIRKAVKYVSDPVKYDISARKPGGTWTDGNSTTGYFISWMVGNGTNNDFIIKLNKYIGDNKDFKWTNAANSIANQNVQTLWNNYQDYLTIALWNSFVPPTVSYVNEDVNGTGKYFVLYVTNPDSMQLATVHKVCRILYKLPSEVIKISRILLTTRDMPGVAYTTGLGPATEKNTVFSAQYLKGLINNSAMTKADVTREISGVITHEFTHVFQSNNDYGAPEGWSVIEGIADCVRYLAGDDSISRRHKGGTILDGYTTTGFFIAWLQEKKDPDFLYKLNKYVGQHQTDFTWDGACWKLLNNSSTNLWNEYQAAIK